MATYNQLKSEGKDYYSMLGILYDNKAEALKAFEGTIKGEIKVSNEYGFDAGWLATHFYSTAEYLHENEIGEHENFGELYETAKAEIQILQKHGYNTNFLERILMDVESEGR